MNILKSFSIALFLFLFVIVNTTFAIENNTGGLVGTVGVENARIISQDKNSFNVAFTITNKQILQTGVKYGIDLYSTKDSKYLIDEKIYNESLNLSENSEIKKSIEYTAPKILGGEYNMMLTLKNESNFPFSVISLGKVKLVSSVKGLNISNESCTLQVEGENKNYTLVQNVDISGKENLKLNCSAVNETEKDVEVIPYFETRYGSGFGEIATQIGGDYKAINFKKGEKKNISIAIPKGDVPNFYFLKFALMGKEISSNNIYANYVVRGLNASIYKVSIDKDYYKAGEEGKMSILWSASSGDFSRSGVKYSYPPAVSLKAEIKNESDRSCVSDIEQPLIRDQKNPETVISFSTKATCRNPKIVASIIGNGGKVLDSKEFIFTSTSDNKDSRPLGKTATIIVITVLLIAVGVYLKKKNTSRVTM